MLKPFGTTGVQVAAIGQGAFRIGDNPRTAATEMAALQLGIELGLTHVDTAEMYGDGRSERLVGEAIRGRRDQVFLASKVLPDNASYDGTLRACEASLQRLQTDYLDLYLLHWWSTAHPIAETMRAMETLVERGLVRYIGVSNFGVAELQQAMASLRHVPLACNQVLYHLGDRTAEYRLIPFCQEQGIAVVGYSPFGQGDFPTPASDQGRALADIAARHGRTPHQVALNFLTRLPGVFTIPKAGRPEHVRANAGGVGWSLTAADLALIDRVFPPPTEDRPQPIW